MGNLRVHTWNLASARLLVEHPNLLLCAYWSIRIPVQNQNKWHYVQEFLHPTIKSKHQLPIYRELRIENVRYGHICLGQCYSE